MTNLFSIMSNLQAHYRFKLDFQKVDQDTGGKGLIHGTKHRKDSQLQSMDSPVVYDSRESKHDIKESEGNIFNPIFKWKILGQKHPLRCAFSEPELLSQKSKRVVQTKKEWP